MGPRSWSGRVRTPLMLTGKRCQTDTVGGACCPQAMLRYGSVAAAHAVPGFKKQGEHEPSEGALAADQQVSSCHKRGRIVALASAAVFVLVLSAVGWHGPMSYPEEDAGARSEAYAAMHMRSFMKWGRSCSPHCCDEVGCHPKWDTGGTGVSNGGNTRITGRHP